VTDAGAQYKNQFMMMPWRVGGTLGRTVFAVVAGVAHDDEPLLGLMETPELADLVVTLHNAAVPGQGSSV
jgi:hypothetical protein